MRNIGSQSVDRALALMLHIIDDDGRNSLATLGSKLGLPPATAYRLSQSLRRAGLIVPVGKGRLAVGPALAGRQKELTLHTALAMAARPHLRRLAKATRSVAHIGVLIDEMVTYIVREGTDAAAVFSQENKQLEAYCSGIGKVLLAGLPETERDDYLATGPFVALTEHTITDPAILRRELQIVAAQGFARDSEEAALGINCLAIPICAPDGETVGALSLSRADRAPDESSELYLLHKVREELEAKLFAETGFGFQTLPAVKTQQVRDP